MHERENREIDEIRKLRVEQTRAHWQALRRLANAAPSAKPAPPVALDTAGVQHSTPAGVRAVWLDFWSGLATHDPADPRFDPSFHDETVVRRVEEEAIEQERLRPVPLTPAQIEAAH